MKRFWPDWRHWNRKSTLRNEPASSCYEGIVGPSQLWQPTEDVPFLQATATGGLLLQWLLGYNFSVAVWVGYIALFGIAVETGVVMVVYLHESLERGLQQGKIHSNADIEEAVIEGAVSLS